MREDAFRAYLQPRLTRRSVQNYVSNCRRVQKELLVELDTCDLSEVGVANMRQQLELKMAHSRMTPGSLSDCLTAVRTYRQFRQQFAR